MKEQGGSVKRELVNKSNSNMLITIGIAGAVLGFSLVASYTLIKQMSYRSKVISERAKAEKQLKANVKAAENLKSSYDEFNNAPESVIGTADKNAKVVLDALPSKYDFPALATSIQKIMEVSGLSNISITGQDSEATAEQESTAPKLVEIPLTLSGTGTYDKAQELVKNLARSIRPFKIVKISVSGEDANLNISIEGITYYQPKKKLDIPLKEVK